MAIGELKEIQKMNLLLNKMKYHIRTKPVYKGKREEYGVRDAIDDLEGEFGRELFDLSRRIKKEVTIERSGKMLIDRMLKEIKWIRSRIKSEELI